MSSSGSQPANYLNYSLPSKILRAVAAKHASLREPYNMTCPNY